MSENEKDNGNGKSHKREPWIDITPEVKKVPIVEPIGPGAVFVGVVFLWQGRPLCQLGVVQSMLPPTLTTPGGPAGQPQFEVTWVYRTVNSAPQFRLVFKKGPDILPENAIRIYARGEFKRLITP